MAKGFNMPRGGGANINQLMKQAQKMQADMLRVQEEMNEREFTATAGGGVVNWSFLQEGLIDRLCLVIAPVADGNTASVSIFEQAGFLPPHGPVAFRLQEAKSMEGSVLWLQYIPLADR